jgi:hypothetical protein
VKPSIVIMWLVVIGTSAVMLIWTSRASIRASGVARNESARTHDLTSCARDISRLRASAPQWATTTAPQPDLAQRMSAVIAAAGLSPSTLASLTPDAEDARSAGSTHRRTASATLTGLTLPRLGALLDAWRTQNEDWIITSIEVAPQSAGRKTPEVTPGADLPLHVLLRMESIQTTEPP